MTPLPPAPGPAAPDADLRVETLLADIATRFVNLPADQVEAALADTLAQVCAAMGIDRSTVWQLAGEAARDFVLVAVVQPDHLPGPEPRMDALRHFPWVTGRVLDGAPVLLTSLEDLPPEAAVDRAAFERFGTKATAVIPARVGGRVLGAASFATTAAPRQWSRGDVARMELIAQLFGNALARSWDERERARGEAVLRDLSGRLIGAQESERAWLAKELHDGLSQELALLAVELDLLTLEPPGLAELTAQLGELSTRVKALSAEVHRLSHGLHPSKLDRLGLVAAVGGLCRELVEAEQLDLAFRAEGVPARVPPDVALCLYRVAQESLWNTVKHSGASRVEVELEGGENGLELRVRDDGLGFDPEVLHTSDSLGLVSLRERVAMVAGTIVWDTAPGQGTTVVARVPPPAEAVP